jgi:predicted dehydrogenase
MPKKEYGFAIIGAGVIGNVHAHCADIVEGAKLVAIADIVPEKADELAGQFDYEVATHDNPEDAISRDDVDVVCVCTPSGSHLPIVELAAKHKKAIICEKPLEITLARVDAALKAVEESGVTMACIFQTRFKPAVRATREAIASGRLGQVTLVDANTKWYRSQEYYDLGGWRGTWEQDGGGSLMNQSIHSIDAIQWLVQPVAKPKRIWAKTSILTHDIDTEDTAVAVIEYDNGALGTIEGATSVKPGSAVMLEVRGMKGTIVLEGGNVKMWQLEDMEEGEEERMKALEGYQASGADAPEKIGYDSHRVQFVDFVAALNEDREPWVPAGEGRKAVEIIRAIYKSSQTGEAVELPLKED